MRPCEQDRTVLSHPFNGTLPARRGTAAAATRRAPCCTSRAPPGLAAPSPRRAPWRRLTGRAAACPAALGNAGRGSTTYSSCCPGRFCAPGAAAGPRAARAPWPPAADPSGRSPSLAAAAGSTARTRHRTQPSRLGLNKAFCCRLRICVVCQSFFHFLRWFSHQIIWSSKSKTHRFNLRRRHIIAVWLLLICSSKAGCSAVQLEASKVEVGLPHFPAWPPIAEWQTPAAEVRRNSLGGVVRVRVRVSLMRPNCHNTLNYWVSAPAEKNPVSFIYLYDNNKCSRESHSWQFGLYHLTSSPVVKFAVMIKQWTRPMIKRLTRQSGQRAGKNGE